MYKNYYSYKRKKKMIKNNKYYFWITLFIILISTFMLTKKFYIMQNSKNLDFAVEHDFTNGEHYDTHQLLRVQYMSLVYSDEGSTIVEVSGLSKESPHYNTSIKGRFKKDFFDSWYLSEIINN